MSQDACPSCGKPSLVRGALQSTGSVRFRPFQAKFLTFRTADIVVHAHMCSSCGSVMLLGDAQKLDQLKSTVPRQEKAPAAADQA